MNNLENYVPEKDLEELYKYILTFVGKNRWQARKEKIEQYFESVSVGNASLYQSQISRLNFLNDQFGWYLYLLESTLYRPINIEVDQQARILPIFTRISKDIDLLKNVGNVHKQMRKLVDSRQPDSELFEILVALVWARNGCSSVEFLKPHSKHKLYDIRAFQRGEEWAVEAKRMSYSEYSLKEREKWLLLWMPIQAILIQQKFPFILDVTFHQELETLDDNFLLSEIEDKLKFVACPCTLVDNERLKVIVRFVDFEKIERHLRSWQVKVPSRQLRELIFGEEQITGRGNTHILNARIVKRGKGKIFNDYVDDISWAAGAIWACDAERSYEKKARNIQKHLSDANDQLPPKTPGVIHVGLETYEGMLVESERFDRIFKTAMNFDPKGKDLRFMFCHLYQAYTSLDFAKTWEFDETVYPFGLAKTNPIPKDTTVSPFEIVEDGVHWLKPSP